MCGRGRGGDRRQKATVPPSEQHKKEELDKPRRGGKTMTFFYCIRTGPPSSNCGASSFRCMSKRGFYRGTFKLFKRLDFLTLFVDAWSFIALFHLTKKK